MPEIAWGTPTPEPVNPIEEQEAVLSAPAPEETRKGYVSLSNTIGAVLARRQLAPRRGHRAAGAFGRLQVSYADILGDTERVSDPTKLRPEDRAQIQQDAQASLNRTDRRMLGERAYLYGRGKLAPSLRTRKRAPGAS